jgi:hypothetical protein
MKRKAGFVRITKRSGLATALSVIALAVLAFKPITHVDATDRARDANDRLAFFDRSYGKDRAVHAAIEAYPSFYSGGVVGPDGFPDILVGQGNIHPDTECDNGASSSSDCDASGTYTRQWLNWIYDRGTAEYAQKLNDGDLSEAQKILAFTYGYLGHAAGDMWAHTLVNGYAKGTFPSISEMVDPDVAKIGIRHIVVEGFIGSYTRSTNMALNAPIGFVRRTFIWDRDPRDLSVRCPNNRIDVPTPYAKRTHFAQFLDNRADLCSYIDGLDTDVGLLEGLTCFVGCPALLDEAAAALAKAYAEAWIDDIDDGLAQWPHFSRDIAIDLFTNDEFDSALNHATDFGWGYVLSMLGAPDFVGQGVLWLGDIQSAIANVIANVPGFDALADWINQVKAGFMDFVFKRAFGISYSDFATYMTNPAAHISDGNIGLSPAIRDELNSLMSLTAGAHYSPDAFATFANARTLASLTLLPPTTLDSLLFDLHVG